MDIPLETELKLQVELEDRDAVAKVALLHPDAGYQDHLVSRYFDTPRLDLRVGT